MTDSLDFKLPPPPSLMTIMENEGIDASDPALKKSQPTFAPAEHSSRSDLAHVIELFQQRLDVMKSAMLIEKREAVEEAIQAERTEAENEKQDLRMEFLAEKKKSQEMLTHALMAQAIAEKKEAVLSAVEKIEKEKYEEYEVKLADLTRRAAKSWKKKLLNAQEAAKVASSHDIEGVCENAKKEAMQSMKEELATKEKAFAEKLHQIKETHEKALAVAQEDKDQAVNDMIANHKRALMEASEAQSRDASSRIDSAVSRIEQQKSREIEIAREEAKEQTTSLMKNELNSMKQAHEEKLRQIAEEHDAVLANARKEKVEALKEAADAAAQNQRIAVEAAIARSEVSTNEHSQLMEQQIASLTLSMEEAKVAAVEEATKTTEARVRAEEKNHADLAVQEAISKAERNTADALDTQAKEFKEKLRVVEDEHVQQKCAASEDFEKQMREVVMKHEEQTAELTETMEKASLAAVKKATATTEARVRDDEQQKAQWLAQEALAVAEREKTEALNAQAMEHTKALQLADEKSAKEKREAQEALDNQADEFERTLEKEKAMVKEQMEKSREAAVESVKAACEARILCVTQEAESFKELYHMEYASRKKIHNKLIEIQGNIRVLARVRPVLKVEIDSGKASNVVTFPQEDQLKVSISPEQADEATCQAGTHLYEFDKAFGPTTQQGDIFEAVQPLVISLLDGYNICIFAYGQTGAGKTFTMEGSKEQPGVNTNTIHELFRQMEDRKDLFAFRTEVSVLEIYNENIVDLLLPDGQEKQKLEIRKSAGGKGSEVPGLTRSTVSCPEDVFSILETGHKHRTVGGHDMNAHSSRSHLVVTFYAHGENKDTGATFSSKLNLIDLAGSERISKTDAKGDRLREAQNINKSLSALGDVIAASASKSGHVPFRNSKLTYYLQDSFTNGSKVQMIVNTSPAIYNASETIASLNFAKRCRAVELGAATKQGSSGEVTKLKARISELEENLSAISGVKSPPASLRANDAEKAREEKRKKRGSSMGPISNRNSTLEREASSKLSGRATVGATKKPSSTDRRRSTSPRPTASPSNARSPSRS